MRERFFAALARLVTRHNGKVLLSCLLLTVVFIVVSGRLTMKTQIADMMPKGIPQIDEFMDIVDDYSSAMTVMVTVESPEKNIDDMAAAADDLAKRLESVRRYKPTNLGAVPWRKKIAHWRGTFPVKGIDYDTLTLVKRVDYKAENEFIEQHGMIVQKTKDLESMTTMYGSLELPELIENINDNFEKEFIDDSENLTTLDGESQAVQGLQNMRDFVNAIGSFVERKDTSQAREAVESFVTGQTYFISPDNTLLLMMLQPAVSMNQFEDAMYLGYRIDDTLSAVREEYPDLSFGRSGAMMIQIDENNALAKDFGWPSVFALLFILILLIGSFRSWKNPFYSVFTLAIALIWVTGMIALALHYVNMMSASFGIVLIGLGIDFGIHFISGFRDGREQKMGIEESIFYMYNRVGTGVVTGALTTAIVFFSLWFTRFKAYTEMGVAIGLGIVTALFAMMILLPALIVWDNKGYSVTGRTMRKAGLGPLVNGWQVMGRGLGRFFNLKFFAWITQPLQFGFLEHSGKLVAKLPVAIVMVLGSAVLVYFAIVNVDRIGFEYDMMAMEPEGIPSVVTQDNILDKFEISPDYAMIRAHSLEECREFAEEFKKLGNRTGLIGQVDAITEYLPERKVQEANIPIIESFRKKMNRQSPTIRFTGNDRQKLVDELKRLHMNIVEIGELSIMSSGTQNKIIRKCDQIVGKTDAESEILALADRIEHRAEPEQLGEFQHIMGSVLKGRILTMANTTIVTLDNMPEEIKRRYVSSESGTFLLNIYPKGYIWNEKELRTFNEKTMEVSKRITGMPMMMMLMIDMMKEKGMVAVMFGSIAILLFLLIDFRSFKYMIFAAIPLAIGVLWMVGFMEIIKMKFNMASFMALPLIIGIGIDDGVHILHRYRIEGPGSMNIVLKYTGRAILLTSLTTMIGFGSMGLASHRGIASMGQLLFVGVGTCFIASAYVLPSLLTIWERIFPPRKSPTNSHKGA